MISRAATKAAKSPHDRPRMRGVLHLYALGVAAFAGIVLCALAAARPGWLPLFGCTVYAVSACALFGVSALYHRRIWGKMGYSVMKRLDHSMIFLFIAGTYTPFCLLLLPRPSSYWLLGAVWGGALAGVGLKMVWPAAPRWLSVPMYIGLGWLAVFALPQMLDRGGVTAVVLLAVGGCIYSVGALLYAFKWPDPWPRTFGHHEFFHAATLLAALTHQVAVYFALFAPAYAR